MKIIQINTTCGKGSTGKIAVSIANVLNDFNIKCKIVCSYDGMNYKYIYNVQNRILYLFNNFISRIFSCEGFTNYFSTKKLVRYLKKEKPDLIHLHNIHGHYLNAEILFNFIKNNNIPVIWTLHDSWPFTGQCPHFLMSKCLKWKNGCHKCSQFNTYPKYMWDNTRIMWLKKKSVFTSVNNLTIVTPSKWLSGLVKESFLKDYPLKVINNGINLDVFKFCESDFKLKYNVNKKIILSVAFDWGIRKGLDVMVELNKRLSNDYVIVLVGTNDNVDKFLPDNIISIHRTNNQKELAEIYSAADVCVFPTREDNYPTVIMESIACGTPVVSFDTGGCSEIIDESVGSVVPCDDIEQLIKKIKYYSNNNFFNACVNKSRKFNEKKAFLKYKNLYEEVLNTCIK